MKLKTNLIAGFICAFAISNSAPALSFQMKWPSKGDLKSRDSFSYRYTGGEMCFSIVTASSNRFTDAARGRNVPDVHFRSEIFKAPCKYQYNMKVSYRDYQNQFYVWLKTNHPALKDKIEFVTRVGMHQDKDIKRIKARADYIDSLSAKATVIRTPKFTPVWGDYWFYKNRKEIGPEAYKFFYKNGTFKE